MPSWIAVASAEHVARGRQAGFMQVCHGKAGPLRRIRPGDLVAYYSPTVEFGGKDPCRAFTAVGQVEDRDPYEYDMGGGFVPWRRDVRWLPAEFAPIAPLLPCLDLTRDTRNWGAKFRFGLVAISDQDMSRIAAAMDAASPRP